MSRILFLMPQLPYPPQQGAALRNYSLVIGLARQGHVIDLLTVHELEEREGSSSAGVFDEANAPALADGLMPLAACCRRIIAVEPPRRSTLARARDTLLQPLPDMALRLTTDALQTQFARLLAREHYDVLQVEAIEMIPCALPKPGQPRGARPGVFIFDAHNAEYVLQRRACLADARHPGRWHGAAYSLIQWQKLVRYERRICQAADHVIAVSEADRLALQRLQPGLKVTVIPNGVSLEFYRPEKTAPAALRRPALVFTGKMDYRPNVDAVRWFVAEVWPLILMRRPEAHFYIVGQKPHAQVQALAGTPGLVITGRVPDVRPYLAGADLCVVPLRIGGGTRLKVLEAMAMGLPVVSTHLGCDGFPFVDDREASLADDPPAFAEAVLALLADPARAGAMARAARAYVTAHYGWDSILSELARLYPESAVAHV